MRVMLHRFENVDKAQTIVCKSRDLMNKLYTIIILFFHLLYLFKPQHFQFVIP